jgi:DNA-binding TFAR19-related protein (PDSD5 family)
LRQRRVREAVGFFHGDVGFVVQILDNPAKEQLLSAKIVKDQFADGLPTPIIEELSGYGRVETTAAQPR